MIKRIKFKIPLMLSILGLLAIAIFGLNAISSSNDKDVEAIKKVLIKSATIADKAYIEANKYQRAAALKENRSALINAYTKEFDSVFSEKMRNKKEITGKPMKEAWVDEQLNKVTDGPDCIDCGVSNIKIKDISINSDSATVTAVLTKYLIDRVEKDGKYYLDKMEAEVLNKATLVKSDNKWLITEYESDPQYGNVTHTLTEEK